MKTSMLGQNGDLVPATRLTSLSSVYAVKHITLILDCKGRSSPRVRYHPACPTTILWVVSQSRNHCAFGQVFRRRGSNAEEMDDLHSILEIHGSGLASMIKSEVAPFMGQSIALLWQHRLSRSSVFLPRKKMHVVSWNPSPRDQLTIVHMQLLCYNRPTST